MRGFTTRTVKFEVVECKKTRTIKCFNPVCGKKMKRTRGFSQTLNPFNKGADGQPKTYSQIWAEVQAAAEKWQAEADASMELCIHCHNLQHPK